jgi:hypothetical protein
MSFFEPDEFYHWPLQMAKKTARDDAQLLRRHGLLVADDRASAALLWALAARWPRDKFDELNIGIEAPYDRQMRRAVEGIIGAVRMRNCGGPRLSARNERDLVRWMLGVVGRPIDGLVLVREPIGWCDVVSAGRWGWA